MLLFQQEKEKLTNKSAHTMYNPYTKTRANNQNNDYLFEFHNNFMGCCNIHRGPKQEMGLKRNQISLKIEASSFIGKREGSLRDNYTLGPKLGSGGFGFVRKGASKLTNQIRAIKTIEKCKVIKGSELSFFAEVDVLRSLDHPNIVKLYEFFEEEEYYHLVTEYIQGKELFEHVIKSKSLSEPIASHFMRQLFSAVAYFHSKNIVHRDLKPENLLIEENALLKVIDFGTSNFFTPSLSMKKLYGTVYYIAPEVLFRDYNEKCDLWSCGVIMYILLSGKPPFYGKSDEEVLKRIKRGEYSLSGPVWDSVSAPAKRLVKRLLDYNSKTRISAAEALQHEWIADTSEKYSNLEALYNLKNFRAGQKFQHAAMTFIASQILSKDEITSLETTFKNLDTNGDGKLSKEELVAAYINRTECPEEKAEEIIRQVDINSSGFIDYTEFIMASVHRNVLLSKQNLEFAFKAIDIDSNGKISAGELRDIFRGVRQDEISWDEIIKEADTNGDGEVDIQEFQEIFYSLVQGNI